MAVAGVGGRVVDHVGHCGPLAAVPTTTSAMPPVRHRAGLCTLSLFTYPPGSLTVVALHEDGFETSERGPSRMEREGVP